MSSFIVSRQEFIKAAGLMCGYEESKRHSHKWFIDNVRQEFEHAYALNVASVNEQYEDNQMPEGDEGMDELFAAYRKKGALIQCEGYAPSMGGVIYTQVADVMSRQDFRKRMFKFFNSVLYQIENDAAHRAVAELFFICLSKLYDDDLHGVKGWWGEIELAA